MIWTWDCIILVHFKITDFRIRPTTYLIIFLVCLSFCIIFEEKKPVLLRPNSLTNFSLFFYVNGDAKKALRVGLSEGFFFFSNALCVSVKRIRNDPSLVFFWHFLETTYN